MTDKEKLIALLTEFGVGFQEERRDKDMIADGWSEQAVLCEQGMSKVGGYSGFLVDFGFDADGKFVEMGAYE